MAEENSSQKWYSHSIFDNFWNHYNHCNEWLQQNGHKVIQFSDDFDNNYNNINVNKSVNTLLEENNGKGDIISATVNRTSFESKMDQLEQIDENEVNYYNNKEFCDNIDSDSSEQLDINEDYLKFIIETKRHQMERKRLREKKLRYNDRVEYVDISKIDSFVKKSCAPKKNVKQEDITSQRNEQMFELYGEDSNVIQGMEAALQLNFDRLCDSHQPKFWPIMPIRM